ncbi:MAG: SpoIIE family protein phosphatase [Bacteroidetes bacterium]|nr:SpoIIE family protein phosphatase [Bacteroidota bacterium]
MARYFLFVVFCFLVTQTLAEPQIIELKKSTTVVNIGYPYLSVAKEVVEPTSLAQIKSLQYEPILSEVPNFGFSRSAYWFKFFVYNTANEPISNFIEIKNPNLDQAKLIYVNATDTVVQSAGDAFLFEKRTIKDKYFRFFVQLPPSSITEFYIYVKNSGEQFHVPLSIGKPTYYTQQSSNEQLIFGLYFGLIAFAIALNLFFYLVLNSRTTLFYVAYLIGLLFLQLSLTGLGFQYLWPQSVYLAKHANPIFANLSVLFLLGFSIFFLELKKELPKLFVVFKYITIVVFVSLVCSILPFEETFLASVYAINTITFLVNILILPAAYIIWKRGYKPARFFIIAFVILVVFVFLFILKNVGALPLNYFTEYGIQIGSAAEVSLLTLAVVDRFKQFKDDAFQRLKELNEIKTKANIELELKVKERTKEINQKKKVIEEKNEEIISSIRYAQRIQLALLKEETHLVDLLPEHFILFKPKDIVSGDFYWISEKGDWWYLAVCDCTGHGVPGGFLTMLGVAFLNELASSEKRMRPDEILGGLRDKFVKELKQVGTNQQTKDGMDISMVCVNKKTLEMEWAGANNPLLIIKNGSLLKLLPNKQPIGFYENMVPFTLHKQQLSKGDCLYLFSDGYNDQFGGPKGKKFGSKQLSEVLLNGFMLDANRQKERLIDAYITWQGNTEQIDDICIIGVKL